MSGTLLIFDEDATIAIACAQALAKMAEKYAQSGGAQGDDDVVDVQTMLKTIVKVLNGDTVTN